MAAAAAAAVVAPVSVRGLARARLLRGCAAACGCQAPTNNACAAAAATVEEVTVVAAAAVAHAPASPMVARTSLAARRLQADGAAAGVAVSGCHGW